MRTPSQEDLMRAAGWLECYEPTDGESDLAAVAAWLRQQAEASSLRAACREAGISVASARKAIRQRVS